MDVAPHLPMTIRTLCLIGALTGCSSDELQPAGGDAGTDAGPQCVGGLGNIYVVVQPEPPVVPHKGFDWVATGRIAEKTGSSFTLDTCHPDADCVPTLTTVTVSSTIPPEVDWPLGAYVTVHYLDSARSEASTANRYTPHTAGEQHKRRTPWGRTKSLA